jgi:phospholipid transport system substrate-binding protein
MKPQVVSTCFIRLTGLCTLLLPTFLQAAEPADCVNDFHATLITAMQTNTYEARLTLISPAVNRHFQIDTIARISLGRNWQRLEPGEQAGYQSLLADLVATTYASRFNRYDGQQFTVTDSESIGKSRMRVRSILQTRTETVQLDYQLQQQEDGWRIYDVIANGVSDLSLKRSSYASLFAEGGLAAVEAEIGENIQRNAAAPSGS